MRRIGLLIPIFIAVVVTLLAQGDPPTPPRDLSEIQHNVPLESIIFDDFDSITRFLRYTDATTDDIERLRDRIRPLCHGEIEACHHITYESVTEADAWLSERSAVLGYVAADGQTYAYPLNILNFHEIVNETLADEPVLITYCPLCNSAVVYSRLVDGEALIFGNTSALHNSDMVMYDVSTDSYWVQVNGQAVLGERTGQQLTPLPSVVDTWGQWRIDHPDTLVLARPSRNIPYESNSFAGYASRVNRGQFAYPVDDVAANDERLPLAEVVLVVEIDGEAVAYPLQEVGDGVVRDEVGGDDVVILSKEDGPAGAAFFPELTNGTAVDLVYEDGAYTDTRTGSTFNLSGLGISGEHEGQRLVGIPTRYTFWFAAVASLPDVAVYDAE